MGYCLAHKMLTLLIALVAAPPPDSGYVTVRSNMPGITLYFDGDYIGRAPVTMHRVPVGTYSLSIVSDDSLQNVYWRLRTGKVGAKLSAAWTLVAINAGTYSVVIQPDAVSDVFIEYGRVANAPNEAKVFACCSIGGLFLVGAAVGFLVHLLCFRND
jgi:hypothetical protein